MHMNENSSFSLAFYLTIALVSVILYSNIDTKTPQSSAFRGNLKRDKFTFVKEYNIM